MCKCQPIPEKMRIYVAGPMRGYPRFNFGAFERARIGLRARGHTVLCPAERDILEGFNPDNPGYISRERYEEWMQRDFDMIDAADAIALLPGWETSPGANRELAHACLRGKLVLAIRDGVFLAWYNREGCTCQKSDCAERRGELSAER